MWMAVDEGSQDKRVISQLSKQPGTPTVSKIDDIQIAIDSHRLAHGQIFVTID